MGQLGARHHGKEAMTKASHTHRVGAASMEAVGGSVVEGLFHTHNAVYVASTSSSVGR